MRLVIDSSTIIGLAKINKLKLLENYNFVVPEVVYKEVVIPDKIESEIIKKFLVDKILNPRIEI